MSLLLADIGKIHFLAAAASRQVFLTMAAAWLYLQCLLRLPAVFSRNRYTIGVCSVHKQYLVTASVAVQCSLKAKFHYAICFKAGSNLVADLQRAEI